MNLELLDPFGRQVPDRVDATIQLPPSLHFGGTYQEVVASNALESTTTTSSSKPTAPISLAETIPKKKKKKGDNSSLFDEKETKTNNKRGEEEDDEDYKAAYHVAFNRRGTYVAVGHASGTVAVHSVLSRTLVALYRFPNSATHGCTALTWSRRSRTMCVGAYGDDSVKLIDTSHPYGAEESCTGLLQSVAVLAEKGAVGSSHLGGDMDVPGKKSMAKDDDDDDVDSSLHSGRKRKTAEDVLSADGLSTMDNSYIPPEHTLDQTKNTSFLDPDQKYIFVKQTRKVGTILLKKGETTIPAQKYLRAVDDASSKQQTFPEKMSANSTQQSNERLKKFPIVTFNLPQLVGGSLQINPRRPTAGLAVLTTGALVLFWVHSSVWVDEDEDASATMKKKKEEDNGDASKAKKTYKAPKVMIVTLYERKAHFITCAAFDPHGNKVYAATKEGLLMGFDVTKLWRNLTRNVQAERSFPHPPNHKPDSNLFKPRFKIPIPGGSSTWHLLVSRNGKFLIINSADGAIRLYNTQECWEKPEKVEKPTYIFQDVVSKLKFASCDLSGDGEYVVGGANGTGASSGDGDKYELYIWNTSTGALMDKLTGPSNVTLYSVAWHPTRSFLAVATSDGIVDIWGPRINWTAFAPDFQALPMNVEYIEREDEFDVDYETGKRYLADNDHKNETEENENEPVDVTTIEAVPVFASDSEDEEEVFAFETKVKNLLMGRGRGPKSAVGDD